MSNRAASIAVLASRNKHRRGGFSSRLRTRKPAATCGDRATGRQFANSISLVEPGGAAGSFEIALKTQVLTVDPLVPSPQTIAQAAAVLKAGGLVSFPTETVYGLGADALQPAAVGRIFGAKGRPAANPVIVYVAGVADVEGV